jgi:hypothetical protein
MPGQLPLIKSVCRKDFSPHDKQLYFQLRPILDHFPARTPAILRRIRYRLVLPVI